MLSIRIRVYPPTGGQPISDRWESFKCYTLEQALAMFIHDKGIIHLETAKGESLICLRIPESTSVPVTLRQSHNFPLPLPGEKFLMTSELP
jgi:hypothetical protein